MACNHCTAERYQGVLYLSLIHISVLRSLFGLAQSYQFSGATRDDFAANNARAEAARKMYEKFGEIPQDILEGTRRSNFAPPITRGRSDGDADDDADRVELED